MVNVFKFVFNTQFVVSKHDHIQHSQQKLETKCKLSLLKSCMNLF